MVWRSLRPVLLIILLLSLVMPLAAPVAAQEGEKPPILVQGTPEFEALVTAVRDAFVSTTPDVEVQVLGAGQRAGFESLCKGEADVVMASAPISDDLIAQCASAGHDFIETVLAYEALVLLAAPEAVLTCVAPETIFAAWQSGAAEDLPWADLGGAALETPVAFYGPAADSAAATLFASLTPAGALREDITVIAEPAELLAKVQEAGASAFAYMSLADFSALDAGDLAPVQLQNGASDCYSPSAESLGAGTYQLGRTLYLYVNAQSAQRPEVQALMSFALQDPAGAAALAPEHGYTAADPDTYAYGLTNLTTSNVGRTFTRPATPVTLSTGDAGTVTLTGTSMLRVLTNALKADFNAQFANAVLVQNYPGNTAGWKTFCEGGADLLQTTRVPTDDELALCAENNIDPYVVDLGYQALVVVAPATNDWLTCLTPEIGSALLGAGTEEAAAAVTWKDIDAGWPDEALLVLVPPRSNGETDYLLATLTGDLSFVLRADLTEDARAQYRAVGVGNTTNGLTYAWWSDVQGADLSKTRFVPVSVGGDCVLPEAAAIQEGSYPLSFPVRYYVSQAAFANPMLRAFLWHMYGDAALGTYAARGYLGLDVEGMQTVQREAIYDLLAAYEAAPAEPVDEEPAEEPAAEATATPAP